nr:hypothetical protein [Pseudobdellovibrionaceae bacterium]
SLSEPSHSHRSFAFHEIKLRLQLIDKLEVMAPVIPLSTPAFSMTGSPRFIGPNPIQLSLQHRQ